MPMDEQEKYRSLTECCEALYQVTGRDVADYLAKMLRESDFEQFMAQKGFRTFAPLACGSTGAVFKTTSGQVLRLRYVLDPEDVVPPAQIHEQLQPIEHGEHGRLFYEILPQVMTDVTQEEANAFESHLKAKGYSVNDFNPKKGDIGKLPDGTLVAVDKDAISAKEKRMMQADKDWLVPSEQDSVFAYLKGTGFISKQEHFYPALRDKRIRGILSDSDLERLNQGELEAVRTEKPECFGSVNADNVGLFIQLVKDGFYPTQAQEILISNQKDAPTQQHGRK